MAKLTAGRSPASHPAAKPKRESQNEFSSERSRTQLDELLEVLSVAATEGVVGAGE
jgi:hypothetical protein